MEGWVVCNTHAEGHGPMTTALATGGVAKPRPKRTGPVPKVRVPEYDSTYDEMREFDIKPVYSLPAFGRFCRKLTLENGHAMRLEDFQRDMLTDHFGGTH